MKTFKTNPIQIEKFKIDQKRSKFFLLLKNVRKLVQINQKIHNQLKKLMDFVVFNRFWPFFVIDIINIVFNLQINILIKHVWNQSKIAQ